MRHLLIAILMILATAASADVMVLNDGTRYTGEVKKSDEGYNVTLMDGKVITVGLDKVKSIELTGTAVPTLSVAEERLASLRRATENMTDIPQVLERYKRFIETNANTPFAAEAQKDVEIWKDRQERGLIHVGNKWITADEKKSLFERLNVLASQVRDLLTQGRIKEAEPLLAEALEGDPHNVSALYLKGVVAYRQEQMFPARKAFEAVAAISPDHAPTLNNLGVILFRQNQFTGSMNYFDQAMLASPQNKLILDNVGEAVHGLPDDQKNRTPSQKASRHFAEQDAQLQTQMSAMGWYRWGAGWVNRDQLDQLHAAEKEVHDKLDSLAADFDKGRARIDTIDREIDDTDRAIRRIQANSYGRDATGNPIQFSYPPSYYELLQDMERLKHERTSELQKLDSLRDQAKAVQNRVPTPKFSGVLQIVGIEGAPLVVPQQPAQSADATTQPTTNPVSQ